MAVGDVNNPLAKNLEYFCVQFRIVSGGSDKIEKLTQLVSLASEYQCQPSFFDGTVFFYFYDTYSVPLERVVGRFLDEIVNLDFLEYDRLEHTCSSKP